MRSSLGLVPTRALRAALMVAGLVACTRPPPPVAPGMIAGLIRDATSGEAIADAIVVLRRPGEIEPIRHTTDRSGAFMIPDLPAGHYDVRAYAEAVQIGERPAEVKPGEIIGLDFTVMRGGGPAAPDLNTPGAPALWRYRPGDADPATGAIEGTVADIHRLRLPGAVVSVTLTGTVATLQTITDDQGRFRVADLTPGNYEVSAYYAVVRRGQLEVRRSRIEVAGGEVVVVPMWLETDDAR